MNGACALEIRADVDDRGRARIVVRFFAGDEGEGWEQALTLDEARRFRVSLAKAIDAAEKARRR